MSPDGGCVMMVKCYQIYICILTVIRKNCQSFKCVASAFAEFLCFDTVFSFSFIIDI